jgi:hypothetical protein
MKRIYLLLLVAAVVASCKKNEMMIPPNAAEFLTKVTTDTYYIQNTPASVYKIPIGVTTVATQDRTINYTITSPTGATEGTHYSIANSGSIVIPAGQAVDTIVVRGLFAGYNTPRKDTLVFRITGGDFEPFAGASEFKLALLKYCDVVPTDLVGNYTRSTDFYNGNPSARANYTASISNWTPVTATSATVVIKNMGATSDNGWGPFAATDGSITPGITATLDWADPANFTVTIAQQNYFNDGSGNSTISGTGTFSACDQTFTITAKVRYAGNGNTYQHVSLLRR